MLAGLLTLSAGAAGAGGGWLAPVQERYEPGATATLVGYTGGPVTDEAFYGYLRPARASSARLLGSDLYVGELVVERTGHAGYLAYRASLTFDVPVDLPAGDYDLIYCTDPCTGRYLGDLIAGPVSIGVDPARRVVREWALDDPEIANLAPGALLVAPGVQTTAGELRASRTPAPTTTVAVTTPAPAPTAATPATEVEAPRTEEDMAWPLPAALVVASAAATGIVLSRRYRPSGATRRPEGASRRSDASAAVRGRA